MHIYVHTYIYIYIYIYVCVYICMNKFGFVSIYLSIYRESSLYLSFSRVNPCYIHAFLVLVRLDFVQFCSFLCCGFQD